MPKRHSYKEPLSVWLLALLGLLAIVLTIWLCPASAQDRVVRRPLYSDVCAQADAVANLAGWYISTEGVEEATGDPAEDADPVLNWLDQSGSGNTASQSTLANRPSFETNEVNGRPILRFDGSNDVLTLTITADKAQLFYVLKSPNTTWASYGSPLERASGTARIGNIFEAASTSFHSNPYPSAVWRNGVSKSSPFSLSPINEFMVVTVTPSAPTGATALSIGAVDGASNNAFDLAELRVYSTAPSTADRQIIEDCLGSRYNITITH